MLVGQKLSRDRSNYEIGIDCFRRKPWKQIAVILFFLSVLAYHSHLELPVSCGFHKISNIKETYELMSLQLEALKKRHNKLKERFQRLINVSIHQHKPAVEYENIRRTVSANTIELWFYMKHQLQNALNDIYTYKMKSNSTAFNVTVIGIWKDLKLKITEEVAQRKRWLLVQQEKLPQIDGHAEWRRQQAARLGSLVQRRLRYLQNPRNCAEAKKLVCEHNQGGFGCKHHHLVFCLMYAYATNRTLILNEGDWTYYKKPRGWDSVFYPLSETCTSYYNETFVEWTGAVPSEAKVLHLPVLDIVTALKTKPLLLPYHIPRDLGPRIASVTSDIPAWWAGQILRYILKPRPHMQARIYTAMAKMNLSDQYDDSKPMVGIHVRRTDKVKEAPLLSLHLYMSHVRDYYEQLELTRVVNERRVYIATDDDRVLIQAIQLYPEYSFYGSQLQAQLASTYNDSRYSEQALTGLLLDLHMLTMCHHVVLTFSSNYGKMTYELMQTNRIDATNHFHSLDDLYYMCSSFLEPHYRKAVVRNTKHPKLEIGDLILYYYFHHNSFGKILTTKSKFQYGPMPWYKTVEVHVTFPFPEYKDVPNDETRLNTKLQKIDDYRSFQDPRTSFVFGMSRKEETAVINLS